MKTSYVSAFSLICSSQTPEIKGLTIANPPQYFTFNHKQFMIIYSTCLMQLKKI